MRIILVRYATLYRMKAIFDECTNKMFIFNLKNKRKNGILLIIKWNFLPFALWIMMIINILNGNNHHRYTIYACHVNQQSNVQRLAFWCFHEGLFFFILSNVHKFNVHVQYCTINNVLHTSSVLHIPFVCNYIVFISICIGFALCRIRALNDLKLIDFWLFPKRKVKKEESYQVFHKANNELMHVVPYPKCFHALKQCKCQTLWTLKLKIDDAKWRKREEK